jgi:hypothetical protein
MPCNKRTRNAEASEIYKYSIKLGFSRISPALPDPRRRPMENLFPILGTGIPSPEPVDSPRPAS